MELRGSRSAFPCQLGAQLSLSPGWCNLLGPIIKQPSLFPFAGIRKLPFKEKKKKKFAIKQFEFDVRSHIDSVTIFIKSLRHAITLQNVPANVRKKTKTSQLNELNINTHERGRTKRS